MRPCDGKPAVDVTEMGVVAVVVAMAAVRLVFANATFVVVSVKLEMDATTGCVTLFKLAQVVANLRGSRYLEIAIMT